MNVHRQLAGNDRADHVVAPVAQVIEGTADMAAWSGQGGAGCGRHSSGGRVRGCGGAWFPGRAGEPSGVQQPE
ncbi:hypothetical protein ACEU3E_23230, partial [Paenibacillus oleatilyticus]